MSIKKIEKTNWKSTFTIIGEPRISEYTFTIDEQSQKSSYIYSRMNLGIFAGDDYGTVYVNMFGGYSDETENVIRVFGKDKDGNVDFSNRIEVDWEDRFNEKIVNEVADLYFITVGLEVDNKGKTFVKKFLSAYDAIAYVNEQLKPDMRINVKGRLKYSIYNDMTRVEKEVRSIFLSKVEDRADYKAKFTQSILIDKYSTALDKNHIDVDSGSLYIDAKVLDYAKSVNGVDINGQYPFDRQFEFKMDFTNEKLCKEIMKQLFKVKKGYSQFTYDGRFVAGGAMITATWDDVPDDIKAMVEIGVYSKEDALQACSTNGDRTERMVLEQPIIIMNDDNVPVLQRFEERYSVDDLVFEPSESNEQPKEDFINIPEGIEDELPFNLSDEPEGNKKENKKEDKEGNKTTNKVEDKAEDKKDKVDSKENTGKEDNGESGEEKLDWIESMMNE